MKKLTRSQVEQAALKILENAGISKVPVQVDKIAISLGLSISPVDLGEAVSGILVVGNDHSTIGYNISQSPVRQRFTIAHELGHYVLHSQKEALFIDRNYSVFKRDQQSETGEQMIERQANQFAAALLMPKFLVEEELKSIHIDLGDEQGLKSLADRFAVSAQAMSLRLVNLGLIEAH